MIGNCAALPETLAEAELFGWERGAFTGAHRGSEGLLETADGGTLFLDEVCSLAVGIQAKLLRAIEFKDFRRVGAPTQRSSDFRLVAAVSEPVEALVRQSRLRADFAYRICGVVVNLPPLRDRGADVKLLAEHFLSEAGANGSSKSLDSTALRSLVTHDWPGNVRELKTLMERLDLLVDRELVTEADLRPYLGSPVSPPNPAELSDILHSEGWDVTRTARVLGIGRTTLYDLMHRHGLKRPESVA